jgi:hypothetical protein
MNSKKTFVKISLLIFLSFLVINTLQSQILISLLLGKHLNTGKLEFGIEGGYNRSYLNGITEAKGLGNFHLGFYFDIAIKNNWYLNTGVRVKTNVGASKILPYSLDDPELDSVFIDGHITRKINYFYVPIQIKYRFLKQFFIIAGFQVGLRHKAKDLFYNSYKNKDDVEFTNDIRANVKQLDAGLSGGLGYKFMGTGMNLGITYYYGLVDIMKNNEIKSLNSTFYIYLDIPIGAGYKEEKKKSD